MKHRLEELNALGAELDQTLSKYADILQDEPEILEPLKLARTIAQSKYWRVSERQFIEDAIQILMKHDPHRRETP